jgi:hypothetical protein
VAGGARQHGGRPQRARGAWRVRLAPAWHARQPNLHRRRSSRCYASQTGFQGGYDAGRDPLRDDMRIYSFTEDIIRVGVEAMGTRFRVPVKS